MIPVGIVIGLVLGRWPLPAVVVAAVYWSAVLVTDDIFGFEWGLVGAAGLAAVNALVGVLVHQGILRLWIAGRER